MSDDPQKPPGDAPVGDGAAAPPASPPAADPRKTHVAAELKSDAPLINCRFDPTGRFVFAACEDNAVVRWELASGNRAVFQGHESWPRGIAFSPDGQTLITSGSDDAIIWWPAAADDPQPIRKIEAHKGWVRSLSVSPDGRQLASCGNDNLVRIWDADTGAPLRELAGHPKNVYSVLFHPSGEFLLSGDLAGEIRQWEAATGNLVRTFDAKVLHTYNGGQRVDYGGVRSMCVSGDRKQLVSSGLHKATNPLGAVNEPIVLRFDWESQALLKSHVSPDVKGIAFRALFHPAGFVIGASGGSGGGFLIFWNDAEDKEFHKLKLPNTAREMDLHPDGLQIATAHYDKQVRISRMCDKA